MFVDNWGSSRGSGCRQLQARILRQETGLEPSAEHPSLQMTPKARSSRRLLAGRVMPVLGLTGSVALAERLATAFDYPRDRPLDLARVCQYVATMRGAGRSLGRVHLSFQAAIEPEPVHRFLASLPPLLRERALPSSSS